MSYRKSERWLVLQSGGNMSICPCPEQMQQMRLDKMLARFKHSPLVRLDSL